MVVVVDLMVVRSGVVVGVGVVRFRVVVGAVVDWQRGWRSIVDNVVNRGKNMRLVVPVASKSMT